MDYSKYKTIVFDCDGVVLDSNQVKIQAYYDTAINLGDTPEQAQALVDYHVMLGGISRYVKFEYYLREIVKRPATEAAIQVYLNEFGRILDIALMHCEIAPNLLSLKKQMPEVRWMVLSGGDQLEVQTIFERRNIAHLFDAGIFGSPDNKDVVLEREKSLGNLQLPALFFGDSKYDHQASTRAGLDFVFLSGWTDVVDWQGYCHEHQIVVMNNL